MSRYVTCLLRGIVFLGASTARCDVNFQANDPGIVMDTEQGGLGKGRRHRLTDHVRNLEDKFTAKDEGSTPTLPTNHERSSITPNLFCEGNTGLSQLLIAARGDGVSNFLDNEGNAIEQVVTFVGLIRDSIADENEMLAKLYDDKALLTAAMAPAIEEGNEGLGECVDEERCTHTVEDAIARSIGLILSNFTSLPEGPLSGSFAKNIVGTKLIKELVESRTSTGTDNKVETASAATALIIKEAGVNTVLKALAGSSDLSVGDYVASATKIATVLTAISATGGAYLAARINKAGISIDDLYTILNNVGESCKKECVTGVSASTIVEIRSDSATNTTMGKMAASHSSKSSKPTSKSGKVGKCTEGPMETESPTPANPTPTTPMPTPDPMSPPNQPPTSPPTSPSPPNQPPTTSPPTPTTIPTVAPILVPAPLPLYYLLQNQDFNEVDDSKFNIDLSLQVGDPSTTDAYVRAQAKWMEVITGNLDSIPSADIGGLEDDNDLCTNPLPEVIDDTHICGIDAFIDGPLQVLGFAGPLFYRLEYDADDNVVGFTTITGRMVFDVDDIEFMVENNIWDSVITHEMGHVLGLLGGVWGAIGLINEDFEYIGEAGVNVWQNEWGCVGYPPIQTRIIDGQEVPGGHWDEECFGSELMTPFVDEVNPLSKLTISHFDDLGYEVNYDASGDYDGSDTTCCNGPDNINQSTSKPSKPPLSDSGKDAAVAFGRKVLSQKKLSPDQMENIQEKSNIMYAGDKLVTVLVEESGYLYDVRVTA